MTAGAVRARREAALFAWEGLAWGLLQCPHGKGWGHLQCSSGKGGGQEISRRRLEEEQNTDQHVRDDQLQP